MRARHLPVTRESMARAREEAAREIVALIVAGKYLRAWLDARTDQVADRARELLAP